MNTNLSSIAAFLKGRDRDKSAVDGTQPIVTISRQRGAGGDLIATKAGEILTEMSEGERPWLVVDKNLAERIIEDHHLPRQITEFFTEEQVLSAEQHLEGMFGINVPCDILVKRMTQTMIHLARMGHVIFVGRAAHVIMARFPRAAHIRIIGSFERRVERIMEKRKCSHRVAADDVRKVDQDRRTFVSTHFDVDIEEATQYDLIFNTDRVSVGEAAWLIAQLISSASFREKEAKELIALRESVLG